MKENDAMLPVVLFENDYDEIHFFGDKCYAGGNDHEIYEDPRTIGHEVANPDDTIKSLKELFLS